MANPLTPTQLVNTLEKWKVPFKLYSGWETRTRPGDVNLNGISIHHTGGAFTESDAYLKFLFETGQGSSVPGPLCQFSIGPSGTVHVGSIGKANTVGAGREDIWRQIIAEDYDGFNTELKPKSPDDFSNGNGVYWGVEINYPGTVPMKQMQYKSAVLLFAALIDAFGWTALSILAHREHTARKWDPGEVDLAKFRRDVRDRLNAGPPAGDPVVGEVESLIGLSRGDSSEAVKGLQAMLRQTDHYDGPVDGNYGPLTSAAVLACRKDMGSSVSSGDSITGWAYAQIQRALAEKYAGKDGKVGAAGPPGPKGADSTVPGPAGPAGKDSTVPGPPGEPGKTPTGFNLRIEPIYE